MKSVTIEPVYEFDEKNEMEIRIFMLHLEQFVTIFGEKLILVLLISVKFDRGQRLIYRTRTRITRQICNMYMIFC